MPIDNLGWGTYNCGYDNYDYDDDVLEHEWSCDFIEEEEDYW